MFSLIKNTFKKIFQQISSQLSSLFGRTDIDEEAFRELEKILLSADTGVKTTRSIIGALKKQCQEGLIRKGSDLKDALRKQLTDIVLPVNAQDDKARIHMLVGINGSGKTTCTGKLAYYYKNMDKRVLLVAADTFRAAAPEQLISWGRSTGVQVVVGKQEQDPASVVFTGCEQFKKEQHDVLIIDTAGRLQTKTNLMNELAKIKRIVDKQFPQEPINVLLTIDSMLGQNSFEQAKLFKESTHVNGIILTKMDGTAKGGIVLSIIQELGIPVIYVTFGEQLDHIAPFNPEEYVDSLLNL